MSSMHPLQGGEGGEEVGFIFKYIFKSYVYNAYNYNLVTKGAPRIRRQRAGLGPRRISVGGARLHGTRASLRRINMNAQAILSRQLGLYWQSCKVACIPSVIKTTGRMQGLCMSPQSNDNSCSPSKTRKATARS